MEILKVCHLSKSYSLKETDAWHFSFREYLKEGLKSLFQKRKKADFFWALQDVSFTVQKGDAIALLGKNGAGKSTLLKILSNITTPTEGEVFYQGTLCSLLEASMGFHAELTAKENIYFNGALLGMKRKEIEKNFSSIVSFSGVEKFLHIPMKKFSSGMISRLGFSIGTHLPFDILLIDEILSVGDLSFQKKCIQKLKELLKEGKTLFFVSHQKDLIRSFCNKGLVLDKGKLVCFDKIDQALSFYEKESLGFFSLASESFSDVTAIKP